MSLKLKYNFLHLFYWFTTCCITGFVAVFLQYKGLTNTQIGFVTGFSCVVTIFLSPYMSSLISKIKGMTVKKMLTLLMIITLVQYAMMAYLPLPALVIMVMYVLMYALNISTVPMLTMIAMNYVHEGKDVNFGLARGIGSASWATSAFVFGQILSYFDTSILALGYGISSLLMFLVMATMPESQNVEEGQKAQEEGSVLTVMAKYKTFTILLIGFAFMFAGATALGTYLINIVKNLGGDTSLYGICMFAMAFSELPVMMSVPKLMKKYNAVSLIAVASVFYVLRNFTIGLAPRLVIVIIGMMFQGMSYGLFTGVITYYVTYYLEEQDQMSGQTLIGIMTTGFGSKLGNVLGGILQDTFGLSALFLFVYIATALGALIVLGCKYMMKK